MTSLRICHVAISLEVGGLERVVFDLLKEGPDTAVEGYLFCVDREGDLYDSVPVVAKACAHRQEVPWKLSFPTLHALTRFVKTHGIDVIHAHNHLTHLYGVLAAIFCRCPVVVTFHGQCLKDSGRSRLLRRWLVRGTGAVVAVSDDAATVLVDKAGVPQDQVRVVRNGIDTESYAEVLRGRTTAAPGGEDTRTFCVGTVCRMSKEKNLPMLLDVFAGLMRILGDRGQSTRLCLVGDGQERAGLEERARQLGVADAVEFAGVQSDVAAWLGRMDVMCLSSTSEGTSIALLEAAASGLPCVATNVGGNHEVVADGVTGILVPSRDVDAMVAALVRLVESPETRHRMGVAGAERVAERYGLKQTAMTYRQIYDEVVAR